MASNPQSRKWTLTINNPQDCGLDRDGIRKILNLFCPDYYCLADETATTGTFHTHIFIYSIYARRVNGRTIKRAKPHTRAAFTNSEICRMNVRSATRKCISCFAM